ncbi:MAG: LytTR family DNA-binding domain-containing protein [Bacteroidota bacterium]
MGKEKLTVYSSGKYIRVFARDISLCYAMDNKTIIYVVDGNKYLYNKPLGQTYRELDNGKFKRIHHCCFINDDHVLEIIPYKPREYMLAPGLHVRGSKRMDKNFDK